MVQTQVSISSMSTLQNLPVQNDGMCEFSFDKISNGNHLTDIIQVRISVNDTFWHLWNVCCVENVQDHSKQLQCGDDQICPLREACYKCLFHHVLTVFFVCFFNKHQTTGTCPNFLHLFLITCRQTPNQHDTSKHTKWWRETIKHFF